MTEPERIKFTITTKQLLEMFNSAYKDKVDELEFTVAYNKVSKEWFWVTAFPVKNKPYFQ